MKKPGKRRPEAKTNRGAPGPAPHSDERTSLELFVHAIGNSIGAAALQVEVLAGSGLSPSQRDRAEAALAQLRATLDQLDALRGRRSRKPARSD